MNALTCNQDSTEKGNQNVRETTVRRFPLGAGRGEKGDDYTSFAFEKRGRSQAAPQPQQSCSDSNSDQVSTKKTLLVIAGDLLIKNV